MNKQDKPHSILALAALFYRSAEKLINNWKSQMYFISFIFSFPIISLFKSGCIEDFFDVTFKLAKATKI